MSRLRITLAGENAEIAERLCNVTGLTPSGLVALLLRKYGKDLETWIGTPAESPPSVVESHSPTPPQSPTSAPPQPSTNHHPNPELPTDAGEDDWKPIEL
jgi:hypothetical protein